MDSRPTVEVCFTPNLYPLHFDGSDIIVVIDVLRATSAICAGLSNGVEKIIPVATIEEAIEYRQKGYIVAAERKGKVVEGFNLGNSPSSWLNKELVGKTVVLTTTNGTQAIHTARRCKHMVIGSLINLDALVTYLHEKKKNVMLLGSGWRNKFCLEDTICAGAIAEGLLATGDFRSEEDSTIASKYLYLSARDNYLGYLKASSHRRRLRDLNLNEDIKYCLTPNTVDVVPIYKDGIITA
ncbi:MAG TPA: 2-phosphosulfolactate phosphatase [Flavobacteriales bacterium]|nr:2-phosphosulfolactate phosphatase [Crocinitomicaceae bacterium]HAE30149.1 2-phosphosulfolactate phosphatase [Flavobacteriales bacterium]|tara:strand:+ start:418 stop:1134 length:717 start_codon:yes stop_codon:yes gene_type:complete